MDNRNPYVEVRSSNTGLGIFATSALPAGTRIVRFAGPVKALADVPPEQLNYVLRASRETYLIPETLARYVNHSCEPNCFIDDDLFVVTRGPLPSGSELTISYNRVSAEELADWGPFWHAAWSFSCKCGAGQCYGNINKYIVDEVRPFAEHVAPTAEY